MDRGVTPALVVEACCGVEVGKVGCVGGGAEEGEVGDLKVGPEVTEVEGTIDTNAYYISQRWGILVMRGTNY